MEQFVYNLYNVLNIGWDIVVNWWWVPLPFILLGSGKRVGSFLFMWLWWRRELWLNDQKKVLLEIKIPTEVLKPLRSMEQVFSAIWGNLYDPPDKWEKWVEGKLMQCMQLEMVSLGGESHLYIRLDDARRKAVEASIYSEYPDAELSVVNDYTKYVPQSIPNKEWEMWGTDYELVKPDVYPIKTYPKFFEERPEIAKEEKRIDPMATLLEGMAVFKPGENLWIQLEAKPIASTKDWYNYDFVSVGRTIADKLAKRPEKSKQKSILAEAAEELATGKVPGEEEEKEEPIIPVEMRLTPGERDIIAGVEEKIGKRGFMCYLRFIYLAKRELYSGGAKAIPMGFFQQFATENLNQPKPWFYTLTKVKKSLWFLPNLIRERRLFVKKRRLFFRYVNRYEPLYPRPSKQGAFLFNTEELATIFHFPGRAVAAAPFVSRVESKKGEAPPGLPMEE